MKISAIANQGLNSNYQNKQVCKINNLNYGVDTVSFMGKPASVSISDFSGIDSHVIKKLGKKYNINIRDFKKPRDLYARCTNLVKENFVRKDFGGLTPAVAAQRKDILNEWFNHLEEESDIYTPSIQLLVLDSLTKNLKENNDKLPLSLNKDALDLAVQTIKLRTHKNYDTSLDFARLYESNVNENEPKLVNQSQDETVEEPVVAQVPVVENTVEAVKLGQKEVQQPVIEKPVEEVKPSENLAEEKPIKTEMPVKELIIKDSPESAISKVMARVAEIENLVKEQEEKANMYTEKKPCHLGGRLDFENVFFNDELVKKINYWADGFSKSREFLYKGKQKIKETSFVENFPWIVTLYDNGKEIKTSHYYKSCLTSEQYYIGGKKVRDVLYNSDGITLDFHTDYNEDGARLKQVNYASDGKTIARINYFHNDNIAKEVYYCKDGKNIDYEVIRSNGFNSPYKKQFYRNQVIRRVEYFDKDCNRLKKEYRKKDGETVDFTVKYTKHDLPIPIVKPFYKMFKAQHEDFKELFKD